MRRTIYILILLMATTWSVGAQEVATDSIGLPPDNYIPPFELSTDVKDYGGFLLDMGMMNLAPSATPDFLREGQQPALPNYNQLFKLNPNITFSQGNMPAFGASFMGFSPFVASPSNLMMSSFRLKNGMRINTYGQYNQQGYRQFNPSALPWQRNNFRGAFELKSSNGNFGIRVEVGRGGY